MEDYVKRRTVFTGGDRLLGKEETWGSFFYTKLEMVGSVEYSNVFAITEGICELFDGIRTWMLAVPASKRTRHSTETS